MIIAIDTSPLISAHQGRGVGTYTRRLIKNLQQQPSPHHIIASPQPISIKPDLIHYPYFDLFFPTLPIFKTAKTIVTIHDLIPLIYPRQFPSGIKGKLSYYLQRLALTKVDAIITDSHASRRDIHRLLGISLSKIHPIHLAAAADFHPVPATQIAAFRRRHRLPPRFFAYVGDINYNKNLGRLIRAFASVATPLVIVTRAHIKRRHSRDPQTQLALDLIYRSLKRLPDSNRVSFLRLDSTAQLNLFYNSATYYIQPSLYDGFGLPVLEAMQAGTPVLCANRASLPEVAGQAAVAYFDPHRINHIVAAIKQAERLTPARRRHFKNLSRRQAAKFSWQLTAQQTLRLYHSVLKTL